jgi:hypothetical protein
MAKKKKVTFKNTVFSYEIEESGLVDLDKLKATLAASTHSEAQREILQAGAEQYNEIINQLNA